MARDYAELLDTLTEGVVALTTSERWTQYLEVQSRFPRYSSNNVLLILAQRPDATRVAGYRAWQALGHQVLAKESALRIFAPIKYRRDDLPDGELAQEIRGFKLVPVFDVSQTEGPELPHIVSKLQGHAPEGVFAKLTDFADGIGFRVERPWSLESGANGDTDHAAGLIRVATNNDGAQQVKTLAHEIGHALLHDPEVRSTLDLARELKELEAESVAYVICRALGMETGDYSFGYVVGWSGGGEQAVAGIKSSTTRIQRAAAAVLATFESEEPVVEAVNVVSAGVTIGQWRDLDAGLDAGERWRGYGRELAGLYEIAEVSDERIRVAPTDVRSRDIAASGYLPIAAHELEEPTVSADAWREFGI
jgi:hypothetical protein